MYWREEPVVGVDKAELPQFTIVGWETNERKIKLATGKVLVKANIFQKKLFLRVNMYFFANFLDGLEEAGTLFKK